MTIGEKIKSARLSKKLTQKQLGKLCGMADSAIRRYELGGANPKIETLQKIADALGMPLSEFNDNLMEIPDFKNDIYGSTIKSMIYLIKEGPCCIPKAKSDKLLKELESCIVKGGKIKNPEELTNFYWDSEVTFSHRFLCDVLDQYSNHSVYDLVSLLNFYLSLSDTAQTKIEEYAMDLYEIPVYREK